MDWAWNVCSGGNGWPQHGVGDYVRNTAGTEIGEIVAINGGYAWVKVSERKRVTIALSDLVEVPKPLQVGDMVRDPEGLVAPGTVVAVSVESREACVDYGSDIGLVIEDLSRLERA